MKYLITTLALVLSFNNIGFSQQGCPGPAFNQFAFWVGDWDVYDTNGDTLPDVPAGGGRATISAGDPLTGAGPVNTTGATSTSRATSDPRKFTVPIWAVRKQMPGASLGQRYGVYLWDVAAAGLIVQQAGGTPEFMGKLPANRIRFLASNGIIHQELRSIVQSDSN